MVSERRLAVFPPLPPTAYVRGAIDVLPFPLQEADCRLFARARHALFAGVQAQGLGPGDQVLVPAYHHGSEVEALLRAGVECVFYRTTPNLEPDEDELARLVGPRCRALYLIHVLGLPRDAARWRRWCDERGLLLIEDAAQAWLATSNGRPVGSFGHLAVFCLYKTLPLPYVSAVLSRPAAEPPDGVRGSGLRRVAALHAAWAAGAVPTRGLAGLAATATDNAYSAARDFALGSPSTPPGPAAAFLLSRLADEDAARVRRENYRLLLETLRDHVPAPFGGDLPDGASPFAFPVDVSDKGRFLDRLGGHGIRAVNFWSTPHPAVPPDVAATAASRRERTVLLPVHQGLRTADLDRIADAVRPGARRGERLRAERVDDLELLRDEWEQLGTLTGNVFATWQWNRIWWEHFGSGRRLLLTALRDGRGTLRAVLPLYLWAEHPLRVARFLGHTAGDRLGPICAPGDEAVVERTMRGLLPTAEWDLLLGEQLPAGSAWGKRLAGRSLSREGSPVVELQGSWADIKRTWSSRLRKELRQDERRLRNNHDVLIRTLSRASDLPDDVNTLFRLHLQRWQRVTRFAQRRAFHEDFAACALQNGWLRLRILEIDGQPAAARYGFRFGTIESGYQSGRDPAWAPASVGTLLLADTISAAHRDGMREYGLGRGGERYKYRFANADTGLETVVLSRGAAGRAAAAAAPALRSLRSAVNSARERTARLPRTTTP